MMAYGVALCSSSRGSFLPRMLGLTDQGSIETVVRPENELANPSIALPSYFRLKRSIDIIGSVALLLVLSPLFITVVGWSF